MNYLIWVFLLITSFSTLSAKETIVVSINEKDIENLGGWPLNRKWYSSALQNLVNSNATNIYMNIAFPSKNHLNPEMDELLYNILKDNKSIHILSHQKDFLQFDSINILGDNYLKSSQFVQPFSSYIKIEGNRLIIDGSIPSSFVKLLLKDYLSFSKVIITLPEETIVPDYNFTRIVKSPIVCEGKDVFIFLDYPGVTSYIVHETINRNFPTSILQVYAANSIQTGNYFILFPKTFLIILFCCTLLPLIFIRRYTRIPLMVWLTFLLIVILITCLFLFKVSIVAWLYYTLIIPTGLYIAYFYLKYVKNKEVPVHKNVEGIQKFDLKHKIEIKRLQEKLRFFEHLTKQVEPSLNIDLPAYIQVHPQSPLVTTLQKVKQIAKTDISVLITGESGTGKEQIAKFLHEKSNRKNKPFVAIHCASLNENLIESELFGYESGAFTGAQKRKEGKFDLANGGTLFLDEICETSLSVQVKLLRVLQEGVFERVGGVESINVSARIIAATNRDPAKEIKRGFFREDLYYRLNGYTINLLPLKDRKVDIGFLFRYFLYEDDPKIQISDSIISWLEVQKWPGNVRELKAATKRAAINAKISNRNFLLPKDFELSETTTEFDQDQLHDKIIEELRKDGFKHRSISFVAREMGIHRATVTEYFRGWVIRFLLTSDLNADLVYKAIANDSALDNAEKFKKKINGYIESVISNIKNGLDSHVTLTMIKQVYFKNLPVEFESDLLLLIKKIDTKK